MSLSRRLPLRSLLALILMAALCVFGWIKLDAWQRQAIFASATGDRPWFRDPPAGTEVFDLDVAPGQKVHAWFWKSPDPQAATVLYLHGARWNLNGSAFRMTRWTELGYSVLAIDYRGFGQSTPLLPSEASAGVDAAAALRELARRQPDPGRRFIYGHSLGGAIAIDLATRQGTPPFAGLIVESSFTSIDAMLRTLKWGRLPGAGLLVTQPFDSVDKIARLRTPVLFIHGTADTVIPSTMSDQLYAAVHDVAPPLKRLVKIEGASHSGAVRSGARYDRAVQSFIRDARAAWTTTQRRADRPAAAGPAATADPPAPA
ncbi:alpha/beta hydrolase [Bordetella genomosp. 10]|uniref:Alpha/beta hydrolase n=1 Tax=Bordetella genomosp. 10 TaxID=1416804 RepID=A0A261S2N8_9BORD|nr:alpha/beta fold hydrolase [Bordetella genomosp. 10]OZI31445.1 alpha/beta hydrolase [Bordetella genomosp. 10]